MTCFSENDSKKEYKEKRIQRKKNTKKKEYKLLWKIIENLLYSEGQKSWKGK